MEEWADVNLRYDKHALMGGSQDPIRRNTFNYKREVSRSSEIWSNISITHMF